MTPKKLSSYKAALKFVVSPRQYEMMRLPYRVCHNYSVLPLQCKSSSVPIKFYLWALKFESHMSQSIPFPSFFFFAMQK